MSPKKKPGKIGKVSKSVTFAVVDDGESSSLEEASFHEEAIKEKKTTSTMSIYEYAALVRYRCIQLGTPGTEPIIEINPDVPEDFDPIVIATKEVKQCLVPLIIRRTLTDGTTEDWHPKDMIFPRM